MDVKPHAQNRLFPSPGDSETMKILYRSFYHNHIPGFRDEMLVSGPTPIALAIRLLRIWDPEKRVPFDLQNIEQLF